MVSAAENNIDRLVHRELSYLLLSNENMVIGNHSFHGNPQGSHLWKEPCSNKYLIQDHCF